MIVKKNVAQSRMVLAVCDDDLLGKVFEEKDMILDLRSDFYKGAMLSEEEASVQMKVADNLNMVGEKTVSLAKKLGLITDENIRRIAGIPYSQCAGLED